VVSFAVDRSEDLATDPSGIALLKHEGGGRLQRARPRLIRWRKASATYLHL
jgi:hypothetical protein